MRHSIFIPITSIAALLMLLVAIACSSSGDGPTPSPIPPLSTNTPVASGEPIPLVTIETPLPTSVPPNTPTPTFTLPPIPPGGPIPLVTIETPFPTIIPVPVPTTTPEPEASPTPSPQRSAPAVTIGDVEFEAEIAHTTAQRVRGLSGRDSLTAQSGMLFVFPNRSAGAFWMRGMLIPLDFVWIGEKCTVVDITENVPHPAPNTPSAELPRYQSLAPAAFNFEINAGEAESLGLEVGDAVRFSRIPPNVQGADC